MTVNSSNGKKLSVESKHNFLTLVWGGVACKTTMEAFIPAVQGLLHKTFSDPNFKTLLTK